MLRAGRNAVNDCSFCLCDFPVEKSPQPVDGDAEQQQQNLVPSPVLTVSPMPELHPMLMGDQSLEKVSQSPLLYPTSP